jgi:hypothetical protein
LKIKYQKLQYQAGAFQELAEDGYKLQVWVVVGVSGKPRGR